MIKEKGLMQQLITYIECLVDMHKRGVVIFYVVYLTFPFTDSLVGHIEHSSQAFCVSLFHSVALRQKH